jgi:hypothetical protein
MDKLNALSLPEKLIAGGGVLMLIASFLPWYRMSFLDIGISYNGLEGPGAIWSILALIIAVVMAAQVLGTKLANMAFPAPGKYSWAMVHLAGGGAIILCIFLKLVNESSYMSIGFFLGIIAAGLLAAGGYLMYNEEKAGTVNNQ